MSSMGRDKQSEGNISISKCQVQVYTLVWTFWRQWAVAKHQFNLWLDLIWPEIAWLELIMNLKGLSSFSLSNPAARLQGSHSWNANNSLGRKGILSIPSHQRSAGFSGPFREGILGSWSTCGRPWSVPCRLFLPILPARKARWSREAGKSTKNLH